MSEAKIDALRTTHGKLVTIELDGKPFCFRKPKKAEIIVMNKSQKASPELGVDHAIGLCRQCFVGPGALPELEEAFNDYCLAFAGTGDFDGVAEHLIKMATGEAKISVK
jgi:hypothetical protein